MTRRFIWQGIVVATLTLIVCGVRAETIVVESVHVKLMREIEVPARAQGVLKDVDVKEGAIVESDDVLASIVDTEARLALTTAKLAVQLSEANASADHDRRAAAREYEVASRNLKRAHESIAKFKRSVSSAEMDDFELAADRAKIAIERAEHVTRVAQLELEARKHELLKAEQLLRRHMIPAPAAGMISEIKRHRGEWVEPGETVLHMIRLDRLKAEGFVSIANLRTDLRNSPVQLHVRWSDDDVETFEGKVVFVAADVEPVSRQVRIWADVENKGLRLKPGLPATMEIVVDSGESTSSK